MSIDPNSPVPVYRQIGDYIRRAVAAGVYRPGEAIPSLRALALELVVNPNTVQRAYEQLEHEGLIQPRKGRGMFVTPDGAAAARSKSEAAVYAAFGQGIHVGQAASIPPKQIRATFDQAWKDAGAKERDEK